MTKKRERQYVEPDADDENKPGHLLYEQGGLQLRAAVMLVTPDLAEEWLKKNDPNNRSVSWSRVESFHNDILAGKWKLTHQGVAFDREGQLSDGQHRLEAIKLAKRAVLMHVVWNDFAEFMDPIDRGAGRTVAQVMNLSVRLTGTLALLHRMEAGVFDTIPVTVAESAEVLEHHRVALDAIDAVPCTGSIVAGLRAACAWTMPINQIAVLDFLQKVVNGEMIKRGDPAYAYREWYAKGESKRQPAEVMFAACNCIRYHIQGRELKGVFKTEEGFRAATGKRRALKVPHTPSADYVPGVAWNRSGSGSEEG